MANKLTELLAEANRRRVFRTAGVYLVAVWGISSGGVDLAALLGIPESILRMSMLGAISFLPVVVVLAWMFDIGRSGIVRDSHDLHSEQQAAVDLASMPTTLGGAAVVGAVIVRWEDVRGENAMLYVDEFFMGRGTDCRVRFYDPLVSRRHARVFHEDGVWYIEDLSSRNGTHVAEKPIQRVALADSNQVRLNDSGPFLRIDLIRAGSETRDALTTYPPGQPIAHVRLATDETTSSSHADQRKT